MHCIVQVAALAGLFVAPLVSAHGYIDGIQSDGQWYSGTNPNWFYQQNAKPNTAGWFAMNQDNGFVSPSAFGSSDITCHKEATVGGDPVPVTAGQTIDLSWNTWPDSHKGPVINYMAAVDGEFGSASKDSLQFFKVSAEGLQGSTWATDTLIANNNTGSLTIPASLKPGNYVLRHEIIALHSAQQEDGAQSYPQCINLKVSGSGSASPCSSGASCVAGTALYTPTDPGIKVDIYQSLSSYAIPGPAVWNARSSKVVREFKA